MSAHSMNYSNVLPVIVRIAEICDVHGAMFCMLQRTLKNVLSGEV